MALIACPECKTEVSDKANACPKCGHPITSQLAHQPSGSRPTISQPAQKSPTPRQVWKYDLKHEVVNILSLPRGAKVLCAQLQKGSVSLWVEIPNTDNQAAEKRAFHIVGTAQNLPDKATKYIGTVQVENGYAAWHVYEEAK